MSTYSDATKETILVVDDIPDNVRVLSALLTQEGYTVRKALNGRSALNAVQSSPPDLILLDIRMPDIDGYEVCERLKATSQTCKIPIIFLSALDSVVDKVKAFQMGGADYITKPFHVEEVLARVEHQLTIQTLQRQLHQANLDLAAQVSTRTAQLQLAFDFEATLKRITDRVRDSLDETHILQVAVQELAIAVDVRSCNAALYDLEQQSATVQYEYAASLTPIQGRVLNMNNFTEGYRQLLHGQYFQFCSLLPNSNRGRVVMLACPIVDDQRVLGDLWLVNPSEYAFTEQDIRLVQQVANQCAIALRQARLYQTLQTQVTDLEQLNRLKDDFLSTVSHELRTPMANIKMALHMLEISLKTADASTLSAALARLDAQPSESAETRPKLRSSNVDRYLKILQDECQREINLITDLLDLNRLDSDVEPLIVSAVAVEPWLQNLTKPFVDRARSQQQQLQLDIAPDLPPLFTEQSYLERILTELLNNACKYTPPGELIVAAATVVPAEGAGTQTPLGSFQISVMNTGVEILPREQVRIFDKFYRIPKHDPWQQGGTGLGLALVKKLTERLGASLTVESTQGKTTFTIQLPLMSGVVATSDGEDHKHSTSVNLR